MKGCGKTPLAVLVALALPGCGGVGALSGLAARSGGGGNWTHPSKAAGDFAMDEASCRQQAIEKVQSSHQKQDAPKWMTRAVGTTSYYFDGNDTTRDRWEKSCLRSMGWSPGASASLPSWITPEMIGTGLQTGLQYVIR